jgi:NhaA family Na+:H+ antiporter
LYDLLLHIDIQIRVGSLDINKPILLWINDGLMAIFFLSIGLELKKEMIEGELANPKNILLPALGALGGMLVPGAIYAYINMNDPHAIHGWAIPTATDIAFSLGILSLLGSRVPIGLKIFLTSLAIFDDVGAIIIIAMFYTSKISLLSLSIAIVCLSILAIFSFKKVEKLSFYFFIGTIMWVALLKSGVHATLAGVAIAMFIPMKSQNDPAHSPLHQLEHELQPLVAFIVLPLFAFANSGVNLTGLTVEQIMHPVTLGTTLGLFLGKQIGIMLAAVFAIKFGLSSMPKGATWTSLYATAILCGVGFTMSLFIGSLAFEDLVNKDFDERLGIITGSILSSVTAFIILYFCLPKPLQPTEQGELL